MGIVNEMGVVVIRTRVSLGRGLRLLAPGNEALRALDGYRMKQRADSRVTMTRWHPNGTRYMTFPGLWIVTRAGDHWGIQVRSLMPTTFDTRGN